MSTLDEEADQVTAFVDPLVVRATGRVGQTRRGKWRLDVLLGVGAVAAVYAANRRNGSCAAVKIRTPSCQLATTSAAASCARRTP
jgi:hypothetical protein